ncbi:hypothetical protein FB451DRAFT_1313347 [Mycena latifolia]|nr:hypothetical protein FB451DRAFT_1313347 [Mycena latifolia]
MATNVTAPGPPLDGTYGALEIGSAVATFLFGILTLQAFNYYREFPQDSKLLKITIAATWFSPFPALYDTLVDYNIAGCSTSATRSVLSMQCIGQRSQSTIGHPSHLSCNRTEH